MKTKISKLLIKEHTVNNNISDPLIAVYVIVTYKSQIIKQFKYRDWKDIPLTFRDFVQSPEVDLREWKVERSLTTWHCSEYTLRREAL